MGKTEPVIRFQVMFQTPFGLMDDLEQAVLRAAASDMDPEVAVVPVSVAVCETLYEVCGQ